MLMTAPAWLLRVAAILLATGLGACATTPRVEIVRPPADLLACANEPVAPDLPAVPWAAVDAELAKPAPNVALVRTLFANVKATQRERDKQAFDYILPLRAAWGDCSGKIAGLKAWSDALGG